MNDILKERQRQATPLRQMNTPRVYKPFLGYYLSCPECNERLTVEQTPNDIFFCKCHSCGWGQKRIYWSTKRVVEAFIKEYPDHRHDIKPASFLSQIQEEASEET